MKTLLFHDSLQPLLLSSRSVLQRRNIKILTGEGRELQALCRVHRVELAFLRDRMEAVDGYLLSRELKRLPQPPQVVMVLAVEDDAAKMRAEAAGCEQCIGPGVTRSQLVETVTALLGIHRRRSVRILARIRTRIAPPGQPEEYAFGTILDLSMDGMRVETPRRFALGDQLVFEYYLPGELRPCVVTAEVQRLEEGGSHFGAQVLEHQSRSTEDLIRRFLERHNER